MKEIPKIYKSAQKQLELQKQSIGLDSFSGFSSILKLAESIQKSTHSVNFSWLKGLRDMTASISRQMQPLDIAGALVENNGIGLAQSLLAQQSTINYVVLGGFSSMLEQIHKQNEQLSNALSNVALSQFTVTNNMARLASVLDTPNLMQFNGINVALQGITDSYLKHIGLSKTWDELEIDELEIVEEVNDVISNVTNEVVEESKTVTVEDLEELKVSILSELTSLIIKSNSPTAKVYIKNIIAAISFLFTFYSVYQNEKGVSNEDVITSMENIHNSTIETLGNIEREILTEIDNKFNFKFRTATTNVNLRYSNNKRSKIIGSVKKYQEVTVIEIRHKWLLVSYIDQDTGEPKSGFVFKKYFKK